MIDIDSVLHEVEDRFWSKVDQRGPDECWEWTVARNKARGGYGVFTVKRHDGRRQCRACRTAYCRQWREAKKVAA